MKNNGIRRQYIVCAAGPLLPEPPVAHSRTHKKGVDVTGNRTHPKGKPQRLQLRLREYRGPPASRESGPCHSSRSRSQEGADRDTASPRRRRRMRARNSTSSVSVGQRHPPPLTCTGFSFPSESRFPPVGSR